jgi:hypothetical protein
MLPRPAPLGPEGTRDTSREEIRRALISALAAALVAGWRRRDSGRRNGADDARNPDAGAV